MEELRKERDNARLQLEELQKKMGDKQVRFLPFSHQEHISSAVN